MIFLNDVLIQLLIFVLGICGFFIAKHIRNHKTKNTPLVCPIGFDCHAVVHSDYSKFLGMPVELGGMIYYAAISLAELLLIFLPDVLPIIFSQFLALLSCGAFLFSLYLISVQIFILKKGCSWCLLSAGVSALIFFLTILLTVW